MWDQDTVVVPRQSEWFGVWDSERNEIRLKEQDQYSQDWLGLKTLDDRDSLFFYRGEGDHMHLVQSMFDDYLTPLILNQTPAPSHY